MSDLDDLVGMLRGLVQTLPAGHSARLTALSNLGNALRDRFEQTGASEDLDEAVRTLRSALESTTEPDPGRGQLLTNLGRALALRFRRSRAPDDRDAAADAYAQALNTKTAPTSDRVWAGGAAGNLVASSRPARAAALLEAAVRLLPELAPRRLHRTDRQFALGEIAELANDAAALALADETAPERERAERALTLLEAGRSVLLGQMLETRTDLTDLRAVAPDVATRFTAVAASLDREGGGDALRGGGPSGPSVDERIRLAEELSAVLAEIRALPGFARFGLPPSVADLTAEAAAGPVVTVNVSRHRCDALLLTMRGVTALPLPGLTSRTLIDRVNAFHRALAQSMDPNTERADRIAAQGVLTATLAWLWDTVAGPVLDALGLTEAPAQGTPCPRIWWAPGGLLGLLPLHAAGHHTDPADARRRTVIDRAVSSHTPTIRALRHARERVITDDAPTRSLVVAMPTTPGQPEGGQLYYAEEEAAVVAALLPDPCVLIEPDPGPDAVAGTPPEDPGPDVAGTPPGPGAPDALPTTARVLGELPRRAIAHFACHGTHDRSDPSRSRLLLHDHADHPLTVAALAPVNLERAQLAYLSACESALTTHQDLLDESIHLTSAFQLAGFPHVVGTLWAIDDETAVEIAREFYTGLRNPATGLLNTARAANALHDAVRSRRDRFPRTPFLWAAHLHAGA